MNRVIIFILKNNNLIYVSGMHHTVIIVLIILSKVHSVLTMLVSYRVIRKPQQTCVLLRSSRAKMYEGLSRLVDPVP